MKPEKMAEILENAARQLGIKVRYETMTGDTLGAGGLCKMRGEWLVIMDRRTTFSDRAALLVESLAGFDTDSVFLPPELRDAVGQRRAAALVHPPEPPVHASEPEPPAPPPEPSSGGAIAGIGPAPGSPELAKLPRD